jgi:hypothetical protein
MRHPRNFLKYGLVGAVTVAFLLGANAAAAPSTSERALVLKSLIDCRAIPDPTSRLACFDKAAAEIDKAEAGGDIVVVDRQQAQAARRQAFGFSLSALSIFDRAATKAPLDRIEVTIRSASTGPDGRWVIVLDDGAVWREIGDMEPNLNPRPGAKGHISKGTVGGYFINIDGISTRVRRDQ